MWRQPSSPGPFAEYSAGEHFPRAIICPRRPIVSQDANAISIIIKGTEVGFLRIRLFIAQSMVERGRTASQTALRASPDTTFAALEAPAVRIRLGDRYSAALIDVSRCRWTCLRRWLWHPNLTKRPEHAAHEPAVDLHQLAHLPQVVVSSVSHPFRLNGEDLRDVLALRHAPEYLAIPSDAVAEEMADLGVPFVDRLRDRLALLTKPTRCIRTYLSERSR